MTGVGWRYGTAGGSGGGRLQVTEKRCDKESLPLVSSV